MRRLTRCGSVFILVTLTLALTGVAGASPHHGAAADGRDGGGRPHQARNEARHDRAVAADAKHDRSRGRTASPAPLQSARPAPAAGTPTAALAPAVPPVVTPAVGGPPVVLEAAQPLGGAVFRGGQSRAVPVGPNRPALAARATPVAGAGSAPWYLSLGAGLPLSSAFGHGELRAAVRLSLPIVLAGIVLVFLILQAQIDKRDPKLSEAPIRRSDDGMSFE